MRHESISDAISKVLRYGVVLSAATIILGLILFVAANGTTDVNSMLTYYPNQVPHGAFDTSLNGLLTGLAAFQPFAIIELGAIILIATPVSRVLISVFLFAAQKDRLYVAITAVVLALLLFSILVTPFIPLFQG